MFKFSTTKNFFKFDFNLKKLYLYNSEKKKNKSKKKVLHYKKNNKKIIF